MLKKIGNHESDCQPRRGGTDVIAVEGRMHPLKCGLPFTGLLTVNEPGSAFMSYDYHIGVDYHAADVCGS